MKKRTHVFLSLLLICISAGLLGLLLSDMRHNAKSVADRLAREELNIDVGIFAKQDIPERLLPGLIDPSGEGENLIYRFHEDAQYYINRFLTYFSEQSFTTFDADDPAALVDFAYWFLKLHGPNTMAIRDIPLYAPEQLIADGLGLRLSDATGEVSYMLYPEDIDSITDRFFGKRIQHTETAYYFQRGGAEACNRLSVAKAMYANEDGSFTVEFDIYESNPQPIPCPFSQEELAEAQTRDYYYDNGAFAAYAETAFPNEAWGYVGTTSKASSLNSYWNEGYDIYKVIYSGQTRLFVVPYGGNAPAPSVYAYDETNHTMTLVFSVCNGAYIPDAYLSLSDPSARVQPELTYIGAGTAVVRCFGEASETAYQLIAYEVGADVPRQVRHFEPDEQYRLNRLLSVFSEQSFLHYDADDKDALIYFAFTYLKYNDYDALEPAEGDRVLLPAATADRVLNRFFGRTVEHTESAYDFLPIADGEANGCFSVATSMSPNGDGTYKVAFEIYELQSAASYYYKIPLDYYGLTASDAWLHDGLRHCGSGTAVLRDYTVDNSATYQVISYEANRYAR
ncbi:MAG: hypothetical protein ACI3V2_08410 [Faecousia sp.]